jgi:DNA-binding NarL/FixJ family response regulator
VSEDAADRILSALSRHRRRVAQSPLERLSDRERHVLTLVGRGLRTSEIATQLDVSVKTIETHFANIKEKLGLRNSRELTRAAVTLTQGGAV